MWTDAWRQLYERGGDLYQNRLDEIRCPTLVIHGGRDPHTPISEMEMLATQIPEASTLFIAQAGHCLHDDPEWGDMINSTICDFFRIG